MNCCWILGDSSSMGKCVPGRFLASVYTCDCLTGS